MADKKPAKNDYQTVVLTAFLISEMALADGYESLHEAATIDRAGNCLPRAGAMTRPG